MIPIQVPRLGVDYGNLRAFTDHARIVGHSETDPLPSFADVGTGKSACATLAGGDL